MLHKAFTAGVLTMAAMVLLSCNGVPGSSGVDIPAQRPTGTVSGFVVDEAIAAADVRIFAFDGGVKGALLASTSSDATGSYSIELRSKNRPVLIEISGGHYNELLSGERIDLGADQRLTTVTWYHSGQPLTAMVTPLTHLAAALAQYKIAQGVTVQAAITAANSEVSQLFGVDVTTTFPRSITEPGQGATLNSEQLYGFQLAALSSLSKWASDQNGISTQASFSTIALSQLMFADLQADGRLDGRGLNKSGDALMELAFGSVPLNSDLYRVGLAQHLLTMAANPLNRTAAAASDLVPVAQGMAARIETLMPAPANTSVGSFNLYSVEPENFYHNGAFDFVLLADHPSAVASVRFELDGAWVGDAANPAAPAIYIDTTAYSDGQHQLLVKAKNHFGDEVSRSFTLNFDNTNPFINLTSAQITNQASYLATFAVGDNGAGVWRVLAQGRQAQLTQGQWQAALQLNIGNNSIPVTIIDGAGNQHDVTMTVALDQTAPQFGAGNGHSLAQFSQAGSVTTARLEDENTTPLRIETGRADLAGVAISRAALDSNAIPFFAFSASDPLLDGVGSGSKLKVQFRYEKNGVAVSGWSNVTVTGGEYLAPLATEKLAPAWLNSTPGDSHSLRVRITDEAGNGSEKHFSFKTDFVVSPFTLQPVEDLGQAFFGAVGFNERDKLHDKAFNANAYSFKNSTGKTFYMRLDDGYVHNATRTVEEMVRKHNVRLRTTTEWQAKSVSSTVTTTCPVLMNDYQPVSEIRNYTGSGWEVKHPPSLVIGVEELVDSDSPALPTDHNVWKSLPEFDGQHATANAVFGGVTYSFTFDYLLSSDDQDAPLNPLYLANWSRSVNNPASCADRGPAMQQRKIYQYESIPIVVGGVSLPTPLNFLISSSEQKGFSGVQFTVQDKDTNQPIAPISGWYLIPADHTITITKTLRTPAITVDNDIDVASPASFTSYTPHRYDKQIVWNVGREITITAVHDAGYDNLMAMSSKEVKMGIGVRQYQIGR